MDRTDADGQNRWKTLFGFTTALTTAITDTKASAYFCPAHSDDDYDDEGFRYGDEKETGTKVPASKRG